MTVQDGKEIQQMILDCNLDFSCYELMLNSGDMDVVKAAFFKALSLSFSHHELVL